MNNSVLTHSNLKQLRQLALLLIIIMTALSSLIVKAEITSKVTDGIYLDYDDSALNYLTNTQKELLHSIIFTITQDTKKLLSNFAQPLNIHISVVDKNLDNVDGITGIAETPNLINIEFSKTYKGGIESIITNGFKNTLYHELHHIVRGWTIKENKFGPGLATAAVNEGLATVFAEKYSGYTEQWSQYPDSINHWVQEILELPTNAPYDKWMMGTHPDGRNYIGYKVGKYIVKEAIKQSNLSILSLSQYSPFEILQLSGLIDNHAPSLEKLADYYANTNNAIRAVNIYKQAIAATTKEQDHLSARISNKIQLIQNPVHISEKQLQNYAGNYISHNPNLSAKVFLNKHHKLTIQLPGKPAFELHAETPYNFFIYEAPLKLTFTESNEITPVKLKINIYDKELRFSKATE